MFIYITVCTETCLAFAHSFVNARQYFTLPVSDRMRASCLTTALSFNAFSSTSRSRLCQPTSIRVAQWIDVDADYGLSPVHREPLNESKSRRIACLMRRPTTSRYRLWVKSVAGFRAASDLPSFYCSDSADKFFSRPCLLLLLRLVYCHHHHRHHNLHHNHLLFPSWYYCFFIMYYFYAC